jgi:hypothetical protein
MVANRTLLFAPSPLWPRHFTAFTAFTALTAFTAQFCTSTAKVNDSQPQSKDDLVALSKGAI